MEWWLIKNKIKEILNIKDMLYKCEYCGVYTYERVVINGLPPYDHIKQHFCCEGCKELYIDSLLPTKARRNSMDKFRVENCEYNNASELLSVEEVIIYLKNYELSYETINCVGSCIACEYTNEDDEHPFNLGKFYYTPNDKKIYDDFDEAMESCSDDDELYEIQIYVCKNCGGWCIDYINE